MLRYPELWLANMDRAQTVVKNIRGQEYPPAIFVHGTMPRCGSNIVYDILEVQPTLIGRAIGISEFPILCNSRAVDALLRQQWHVIVSLLRIFQEWKS